MKRWFIKVGIDSVVWTLLVSGLVFGIGVPYTVNVGLLFIWVTICLGLIIILGLQAAIKMNDLESILAEWKPSTKADNYYLIFTCVCEIVFLAAFGYFITALCFTIVQVFWYISKGMVDEQMSKVKGE
jgi:hypothetical protein